MIKFVDMHELLNVLDDCEILLRFQPIPVAARSKGAAARLLGMRVLISPGTWMSLL